MIRTASTLSGLFALLLLGAAMPARAAEFQGWNFGAGASFTGFSDQLGDVFMDTRVGPRLSLGARFRLGENVALMPELSWASKGANAEAVISGLRLESGMRLEYLELSLLVRALLPGRRSWIRSFALAGPVIAWRFGGERNSSVEALPPTAARVRFADIFEDLDEDLLDNVHDGDFGLCGGLGFVIGSGRTRFIVEGRYTNGYNDVVKGGVGGGNRSFALLGGLELR